MKSEIEGRKQAEFTVIYEKKGVLTCCRHFTNCGYTLIDNVFTNIDSFAEAQIMNIMGTFYQVVRISV